MKAWTTIGLFSLLVACDSTDGSETEREDASVWDDRELPVEDGGGGGGYGGGPCVRRRDTVIFKFDGGTFVISVPTLCNPTPYIEKGDPPWRTPSL